MQENYFSNSMVDMAINIWKVLWKYAKELIMPFVVPTIMVNIGALVVALSIVSMRSTSAIVGFFSLIMLLLGLAIMFIFLWQVLRAMVKVMLRVKNILHGLPIDYENEKALCAKKIPVFLSVLILTGLMQALTVVIGMLLGMTFASSSSNLLFITIPFSLALFVLFFMIFVYFMLAGPIVVLEDDKGAVQALKLSYNMVKEKKLFIPIIVVSILIFIPILIASFFTNIPVIGYVINFVLNLLSGVLGALWPVYIYLNTTRQA